MICDSSSMVLWCCFRFQANPKNYEPSWRWWDDDDSQQCDVNKRTPKKLNGRRTDIWFWGKIVIPAIEKHSSEWHLTLLKKKDGHNESLKSLSKQSYDQNILYLYLGSEWDEIFRPDQNISLEMHSSNKQTRDDRMSAQTIVEWKINIP